MEWNTIEKMPHAHTDAGRHAVRILTRHESTEMGSVTREFHTLQLLTPQGWKDLHERYHFVRDHSGNEENQRRRGIERDLKRYAAYLYEGDLNHETRAKRGGEV